MKFQSHFKKTIAMTLITGMLVLPLPGLAAATAGTAASNGATKYWNTDSAVSGGGSATHVKHKDTGSMGKTVGTSAAAGAATGAISSGVQSAVTSGASSAISGAASGAVGGLIMGAAGGLITATLGAAWSQIIMGTIGTLMTIIWTDYFFMLAANIDAAQLALEYMVYDAMKDVTDEWDPAVTDRYEKAAKTNETENPTANVPTDDMSKDTATEPEKYNWDFEVQVLKNIGIEVVNKKKIYELAEGRTEVVDKLSQLVYSKGNLVLDTDLNHQTFMIIKDRQAKNFQWMSTAGIARAELGLETAYQAAVDAGGDAASDITSDTSGSEAILMSTQAPNEDKNEQVALKDMPTHKDFQTAAAQMRVQSLMNLELAQRINLANTLQGNSLSIEAARALKQAPRAIRVGSEDEGGNDE